MSLAVFPQVGGDAGVAQTLSQMAALSRGAMLDPVIRDQAALVVSQLPRGDRRYQCFALCAWVGRAMRYVADPAGVEALHDPRLVARGIAQRKLVYGDCDDMSMYLAALLKSVGLSPRFRAVGYEGRPWQHVYVKCEGLALDPTRDPWAVTLRPFRETSAMEKQV